jgi:hypothetical protein
MTCSRALIKDRGKMEDRSAGKREDERHRWKREDRPFGTGKMEDTAKHSKRTREDRAGALGCPLRLEVRHAFGVTRKRMINHRS